MLYIFIDTYKKKRRLVQSASVQAFEEEYRGLTCHEYSAQTFKSVGKSTRIMPTQTTDVMVEFS